MVTVGMGVRVGVVVMVVVEVMRMVKGTCVYMYRQKTVCLFLLVQTWLCVERPVSEQRSHIVFMHALDCIPCSS